MLRRLLLVVLLYAGLALGAVAQDSVAPNYQEWVATAERAELVIDAERAADSALEVLRSQIVDWRDQFTQAQGVNAARIETLRAQIAALGPPPAEEETEPPELASQRADLTARLASAEAPVRRAEAELRRAQGLIGEIDALIERRRAGELLRLEPSPLNPANWPSAIEALMGWAQSFSNEVLRQIASPVQRVTLSDHLPLVVFYLLVALVLLARGWRWTGRLMDRPIADEITSPVARLVVFALSLVQHAMPVFGVLALAQAIEVSGMVGLRGSVVLSLVPTVVVAIMAALWIGRQVFPARETAPQPLDLPPQVRARGRMSATLLGVLFGMALFVQRIAESESFSNTDRLVLTFPIVLMTGLLLMRIGRYLIRHGRGEATGALDRSILARIAVSIGRAVFVLGLMGPILAGVGYFTAGSSFLFPAVLSLALLALVGVVQRLVADFYGALTGRREGLNEALTPTLIGFVLSLLSIPIFALIWGVRPAQLADVWEQMLLGFSIGGVQISPSSFLMFALVFAAGYTATRLVQATLRNSVLPKTRMDAGGRTAVLAGTGYLGVFLSALAAITTAGIDLSSLAIVAGALSVGIGFGLQTIVSNFVSGIILLVERPIKEGDWIEVNGVMGYVRAISVRSTRIETFDRSDVIVPNADLISGVVTNMTHHDNTGRVIVPVGVAYGTDTRRVEKILRELAEAHPMVLLNPPPNIVFHNFGADSLNFEIRAILRDVNWMLSVKSELNHAIAGRFAEEGIEIPFAQRDIWLRNPEALRGMAPPPASDATDPESGETT